MSMPDVEVTLATAALGAAILIPASEEINNRIKERPRRFDSLKGRPDFRRRRFEDKKSDHKKRDEPRRREEKKREDEI